MQGGHPHFLALAQLLAQVSNTLYGLEQRSRGCQGQGHCQGGEALCGPDTWLPGQYYTKEDSWHTCFGQYLPLPVDRHAPQGLIILFPPEPKSLPTGDCLI